MAPLARWCSRMMILGHEPDSRENFPAPKPPPERRGPGGRVSTVMIPTAGSGGGSKSGKRSGERRGGNVGFVRERGRKFVSDPRRVPSPGEGRGKIVFSTRGGISTRAIQCGSRLWRLSHGGARA